MGALNFDNKPPRNMLSREQRGDIDALAARLREQPGKWAWIGKSEQTRPNLRAYHRRGLETTTRIDRDGADVYVRWRGARRGA
jgi:hypothetical protein